MKRSFLGAGIIGILMMLSGTVFALQGDGMIAGSVMTGNPFWIYAGSAIAVLGLVIAALVFAIGSRRDRQKMEADEKMDVRGDSPSDSPKSET
ncbi:MAG: hypothetical protein OK439_06625 [Thaumarchaeota archaeon]|nr:hypothetical protein [Nitrososphaerota archaeon]